MNESAKPSSSASSDPVRNEGFARLFVQHQRRIHGFIRTLIPNDADSEEVLQETCIIGLRKYDDFLRAEDSPQAESAGAQFMRWICTIAKFEAFKFRREHARASSLLSDELIEDLAERQLAATERAEARHEALAACMGKLRGPDRELLRLCYEDNQTVRSAAADLNRPENTVYKALARIRRQLMDCINRALLAQEGRS